MLSETNIPTTLERDKAKRKQNKKNKIAPRLSNRASTFRNRSTDPDRQRSAAIYDDPERSAMPVVRNAKRPAAYAPVGSHNPKEEDAPSLSVPP